MRQYKHPVRCVETGEEYESIKAAAKAHYGYAKNLWRALTGRRKTAYGYHWEYV